jgi:hypothetical protein
MADSHVTLTGNLIDDPDLRYTPNGNLVATFRLAVTARAQRPGAEVLTKRPGRARLRRPQRRRRGGEQRPAGDRSRAQPELRPSAGRRVPNPTAGRHPAQRPPRVRIGQGGGPGPVTLTVPGRTDGQGRVGLGC